MSEEKLYVVKNDEGKYFDIDLPPWWDDKAGIAFKRIDLALWWAKKYGGHVVTLIEEPEKVALSEKQAKIVYNAHCFYPPATYISNGSCSDDEESLLMEAYVNGYTVKKEPVSLVYVPGTNKDFVYCKRGKWSKHGANPETPVTPQPIATWRACEDKDESLFEFTDAEITKFGLQDCEKEGVK